MTTKPKPNQEFHPNGTGQHRLVDPSEPLRLTAWAGYTSTTYMHGWVGFTAYYGVKEGVETADTFAQMISTC